MSRQTVWSRCLFPLIATALSLSRAARLDGQSATQAPAKQLILISIDGMTPIEYTDPDGHGLKIPNLREIRASGCASPGMLSVFPASTYPNHTSMITGQPPAEHGIATNTPLDPFNLEFGGWFYFAERIKVPTLWSTLHAAGLKTAAVSWPVTVGAPVDLLLPEYRPVRTEEDVALMHLLASPGLFQRAQAEDGRKDRPMSDLWRVAAAVDLLKTEHPALLALHLSDLDEVQHKDGPHTPESHAQLERVDAEIGTLRRAVAEGGQTHEVAWMIVSDHGFLPVRQQVNPLVKLRDAGLITTDATGKVTGWKVFGNNLTGSMFLRAHNPKDQGSVREATSLMEQLAKDPANGIARVDTPADLRAMGADPEAFLALEAAPGFGFGAGLSGPLLGPPASKGAHGYNPDLPEMRSSFLMAGAGVHRCDTLPHVKVLDVGPTAAALLGVRFAGTPGIDVNHTDARR